jgi:biopolymer transport protein ExbD/biopolymer transport protein TolR
MNVGAGGGRKKSKVQPAVNVTPLVDVVLVLLIIFMVVTPLLAKQFWVHVPKDEKDKPPPPEQEEKIPLVMTVDKDGTIRINREEIARDDIKVRLPRMFAARGDHVLVFDADNEANYGEVMQAMDEARGAGAITIAVSPQEIR